MKRKTAKMEYAKKIHLMTDEELKVEIERLFTSFKVTEEEKPKNDGIYRGHFYHKTSHSGIWG